MFILTVGALFLYVLFKETSQLLFFDRAIGVSLIVGIPASMIWRAVKGDKSVPAPHTTIYKD